MLCIHCGESFRLTKYSKDKNVCQDCSGEVDDFTIPDEDLTVMLNNIKCPGGKTKAHFDTDYYEEES